MWRSKRVRKRIFDRSLHVQYGCDAHTYSKLLHLLPSFPSSYPSCVILIFYYYLYIHSSLHLISSYPIHIISHHISYHIIYERLSYTFITFIILLLNIYLLIFFFCINMLGSVILLLLLSTTCFIYSQIIFYNL